MQQKHIDRATWTKNLRFNWIELIETKPVKHLCKPRFSPWKPPPVLSPQLSLLDLILSQALLQLGASHEVFDEFFGWSSDTFKTIYLSNLCDNSNNFITKSLHLSTPLSKFWTILISIYGISMAPILTWLCIMIAVIMRVANMIPINPSHLDSKILNVSFFG